MLDCPDYPPGSASVCAVCMSCFSGAEAVALQGAAALGFAKSELTRLHGRWTGLNPDDLRLATYDSNAKFVESLGLDATVVLGPRPDIADRVPDSDG